MKKKSVCARDSKIVKMKSVESKNQSFVRRLITNLDASTEDPTCPRSRGATTFRRATSFGSCRSEGRSAPEISGTGETTQGETTPEHLFRVNCDLEFSI